MNFSIEFDALTDRTARIVAAFGVFDGVHPGHRLIIRHGAEIAAQRNAQAAAITFVPHPRAVLRGMEAPELIISVEERLKQLRSAGAALTGVIPFTPEFGAMEPELFLNELLNTDSFTLCGICVGEDWRFGKQGKGDAQMLEKFCAQHDLGFRAVKRLKSGETNISSSEIRERAARGDIAGASAILGRDMELSGTVVRGFQAASRDLNAPTANLEPDHGLLFPDGVYAGKCFLDGTSYAAVLNIGMAPTYGVNKRRIEVHLLDFQGDLYGRKISVGLLAFLRGEKKFPSPAALKEQITRDIAQAAVIYNKSAQQGETS